MTTVMIWLTLTIHINLLEYPIPTAATATRPTTKPSHGDILGTKRVIIDPLASKGPGKNSREKIKNKKLFQE